MSVSTMAPAPYITDVQPGSEQFQDALRTAGGIVNSLHREGMAWAGEMHVYSRHAHFHVDSDEVMFEELVGPGELRLYTVTRQVANHNGLPSTWAIAPDGTVVVTRFADRRLHEGSKVDVTTDEFRAMLAEMARRFAAEGLNETLEITAIGMLFPVPEGQVTLEVTNEVDRTQTVTFVTPTERMLAGEEDAMTACWGFNLITGEPTTVGWCATESGGHAHKVRLD